MAYEKYRFDVLIVGDDWKGSNHYITIEEKLAKKGSHCHLCSLYPEYFINTFKKCLKQNLRIKYLAEVSDQCCCLLEGRIIGKFLSILKGN